YFIVRLSSTAAGANNRIKLPDLALAVYQPFLTRDYHQIRTISIFLAIGSFIAPATATVPNLWARRPWVVAVWVGILLGCWGLWLIVLIFSFCRTQDQNGR